MYVNRPRGSMQQRNRCGQATNPLKSFIPWFNQHQLEGHLAIHPQTGNSIEALSLERAKGHSIQQRKHTICLSPELRNARSTAAIERQNRALSRPPDGTLSSFIPVVSGNRVDR
ncbi:hypothetical protein H2248_008494 [Termitomyces sp. 'cryptogamus']|nr:hypothetical protein H2248_008494 [Termitomyces sp. 'cryptogamus']